MANAKFYKGTGTPPSTITDGNVYFDLTNKKILVDHKTNRYTLLCTDTVPNVPTKTSQLTNDSITYASIGAAATSHSHAASDITSGTLSINQIPSIPMTKLYGGFTSVCLWENGSPATSLAPQIISRSSSTAAGKDILFVYVEFNTSTDATDGRYVTSSVILPPCPASTISPVAGAQYFGVTDHYGIVGFTSGNYYYGRSNSASSAHYLEIFHIVKSSGAWAYALGAGYRNNDANNKFCIPYRIWVAY